MLNNLFNIPEIELKSQDEIVDFQNVKLKKLLKYLNSNSKFYQSHFKKNNIDILEVKGVEDLQKIPPTTKTDINKFNFDFFCVERDKIIDYSTTTGTTGTPVIVGLTEKDLQRLAYNEAISLAAANGKPTDIYQLTTTIDRRFMAGLAYFSGVRELGCGIIRVGSGIPQLQIDTIINLQPNTLIAVPSFVIKLIDYAKKIGFDLAKSSVEKIICIGESIRNKDLTPNKLYERIIKDWDVQLFSTYASTEMGTAYTECHQQNGGHEHPSLIISELLDEHDNVVSDKSAFGELCITTLGVEGMPLLRFKTGDIVRFYYDECTCGRTTKRISPVVGRKNQMIKYKGTTIYPPAILNVLNEIESVKNYLIKVRKDVYSGDQIDIYISTDNKNRFEIINRVNHLLQAKLRVKPSIFLKSNKEIIELQNKRNLRKPEMFYDERL